MHTVKIMQWGASTEGEGGREGGREAHDPTQ